MLTTLSRSCGRGWPASKVPVRRPSGGFALCEASQRAPAQQKRDGGVLFKDCAKLVPEAIGSLGSKDRRTYTMFEPEARLAPGGSFEISGDGMRFSKVDIT